MLLFGGWVDMLGGVWWGGGGQLTFWGRGGAVQKRESPDFRSPEVAISTDF